MKTTITFIIAILIAGSSTVSSASELNKTTFSFEEINETSLKLEPWMEKSLVSESDDSDSSVGTIVDIAVSNPDFSILVEAVTKAGLAGTLSAVGPFTVFAPTNAAFTSLFKELNIQGVSDLTAEQLTPILLYHVVSGKVMSTDLSNGKVGTLNQNNKLTVDLSNGVKINESKVTAADITGKNGVIHVVDKVLIPE